MSAHTETDSPESTVAALSHLAFCALVALAFARQDGTATTLWAENLFLTRWLATAQKQKRFPRCVATDIALLLERDRSQGPAAGLRQKFDYLWRSCSGDIAAFIRMMTDYGLHASVTDSTPQYRTVTLKPAFRFSEFLLQDEVSA